MSFHTVYSPLIEPGNTCSAQDPGWKFRIKQDAIAQGSKLQGAGLRLTFHEAPNRQNRPDPSRSVA